MKKDTIQIIIILAALVVVYAIYKKITNFGKGIGIGKSEEDKESDKKAEYLSYSAFSPLFFQTAKAKNNNALILTAKEGNRLAVLLRKSHGILNDNEKQFISVFKSLKTKSQISHLAHIFKTMYNEDMLSFIKEYFGDDWGFGGKDKEYNEIIDYVDSLPDYNKK